MHMMATRTAHMRFREKNYNAGEVEMLGFCVRLREISGIGIETLRDKMWRKKSDDVYKTEIMAKYNAASAQLDADCDADIRDETIQIMIDRGEITSAAQKRATREEETRLIAEAVKVNQNVLFGKPKT